MGMNWRGPEAMKLINMAAGKRVDAAARFVRDKAKELVSEDQPTFLHPGPSRSRTGLEPSLPGFPPKKVTGHLRLNIKKEFDRAKSEARVGTNVPYGKHLELGTRKMAPRPWMRWTLRKHAAEIRARFGIGEKV